ncbi:AMSH-like ubiquitin thioesterase 3 [Salvia splendens]|uniref:AMSH-like ubiquitin thioesterase 3 n=1 Tax=Salvia splendens TaxID=180675 RepID=UPI001C27573C|nr:AMSH-like ubiquitin thioesterase 3 [Salvia splendens]
MTRKVDVDNRISLRNYYRIADNILKQANIYREEKNLIDLYVILLRYSSLVSETIPYHKDYQVLCSKERSFYKKKLLAVLDELEALKPKVRLQLDEQKTFSTNSQMHQLDGPTSVSYTPSVNNKASLNYSSKQMSQQITAPSSSLMQNNDYARFSSPKPVESQFQKMSLGLPLPKQETLSRHSLLGPTGLRGQWLGPMAEVKVNYPLILLWTLKNSQSESGGATRTSGKRKWMVIQMRKSQPSESVPIF